MTIGFSVIAQCILPFPFHRQIDSIPLHHHTLSFQHHVFLEMTPPLIALEEHYYSNAIFESIDDKFQRYLRAVPGLADQLREVGDGRLAAMDQGHIALQVVSHAFTPG